MNEREMRKRFRKGLIVCSFMGVLILCVGITVLGILNKSLSGIMYEQMQTESHECRRRILRQIDKDFEALNGLAMFLDGYMPENQDEFNQRFYDAKHTNTFVSMAYVSLDGRCVLVNTDLGIETGRDYHELGEGVAEIIDEAFKGRFGVSSIFDSKVTSHRVFAYAVPVYNEAHTEIIAVLAASNHVDVFEEQLYGEKLTSGKGTIHLVDSDGSLLISSTDPENKKNIDMLLYSSLFDFDTQIKIRNAISHRASVFCTMTYEKRDFQVYLSPAGVNDWYIMCANNQEGVSHIAHRMVKTMSITFGCLIAVMIILLTYAVRMNVDNNRNLFKVAYKDPLTDVDNLARFTQKLSKEREDKAKFSLIALNIHQFKFINEIMGEKAADEILVFICNCIKKIVKDDEFFCRAGGDLFFIFLRDTNGDNVAAKIDNLISEISSKSVSGQMDYMIRMYAGILIWSGDGDESLSNELMLTRARFAMNYAKNLHGQSVHVYNADIHKTEEMENYVETHMHHALESGEFHLFLQPKMNLKTGELSSAEALVRWITGSGKMIYPDAFIPQFERNGFCVQLDLYMFEQACKQIRAWMDSGAKAIPISVNQSKLLFFDKDYVSNLESIIEKYQVPANMITLEILESLVLEHADEMNGKLRKLREIGFKISMDDFGSGYSSFNTLGTLEIDELKLDRAFLLEISKENGNRFKMIMEHIVNLTKSLNISTVAEGVETVENEALIQSLGCDYGQGYLYSRPVSSEEFSGKYMEE